MNWKDEKCINCYFAMRMTDGHETECECVRCLCLECRCLPPTIPRQKGAASYPPVFSYSEACSMFKQKDIDQDSVKPDKTAEPIEKAINIEWKVKDRVKVQFDDDENEEYFEGTIMAIEDKSDPIAVIVQFDDGDIMSLGLHYLEEIE